MVKFKAIKVASFSGLTAIKIKVMNNGPVKSMMSVYQDFFSYLSGIYTYMTRSLVGGHSVKV
jgi:hypothetical protein